jgi:hypothetical protein
VVKVRPGFPGGEVAMASASGAGPKSLSSTGFSDSWVAQKGAAIKVFDEFRVSTPELQALYTKSFDKLPEEIVCRPVVYGQVFHYMLNVYHAKNKKDDDYLEVSTVVQYMSGLLNHAADRFKATGSDASKLFFTCLEPKANTESARWWVGMKKNAHRLGYKRSKDRGAPIDKSGTPLCLEDIKEVIKFYAKDLTPENAKRAFAVTCLWAAVGRSGEIAYLDWGSMKWDRFNQCVYAEWFQLKTTKAKIAAFVAGFDRHICWFLRLGDFLILCDVVGSSTPSDVAWVFADLQMRKSPGIVFHLTVQKSFLLSFHACSKNAIFAEMHAFVHAFVQCFLVCMLLCEINLA